MADPRQDRWAAHPVLAAAVRIAVILVPLGLSVLSAVLVARALPAGDSTAARVGWWLAVFLVSTVVLFVSDRLARRLLPLAVLLELSLVFPDRAPSRLRSARTPGVRELEARLQRLRAHGATTPPLDAAQTLVSLVGMLGLHDKRTRGHSERVRALVDLLTEEMGLPEEERSRARWAALVHDLGKLSVPIAVLNKPQELDHDEWETVRRHPDEGVRLAAGLLPWLGEWGRAVGEHHERWDGLGYPNGLAGEEISLAARIVSVADSYEVMTSGRPYSRARTAALARTELTACAGKQFDPAVVRSFLSISLGNLRWVLGPLTWLAEVPLLALDRSGQAMRLASAAVGIGGLTVAGAIAPPAANGSPPDGARPPASAADGFGATAAPTPTPAPTPRADAGPASPATAATTGASSPAPGRAPTAPTGLEPGAGPGSSTFAPRLEPGASSTSEPADPTPTTRPDDTAFWFSADDGEYRLEPSGPTGDGVPDPDEDGQPGVTLRESEQGLNTYQPSERLVLTGVAAEPLRLVGVPRVVLWSRMAEPSGNARVQARLEQCGAGGSCVSLGEGQVEDGTWSKDGAFTVHELALDRLDVTVAAGSRLRLTLVANDAGTSGDLLVGLAARSVPSRLILPVR